MHELSASENGALISTGQQLLKPVIAADVKVIDMCLLDFEDEVRRTFSETMSIKNLDEKIL